MAIIIKMTVKNKVQWGGESHPTWCLGLIKTTWYHYRNRASKVHTNLPAAQETWVWSLGQEDPWSRKWQPTPVFLPGESHGQRTLASYSPWGHKESDTTERITLPLAMPWTRNLLGWHGLLRTWCFFLSTRRKYCEVPLSYLGAGCGDRLFSLWKSIKPNT